MIDYHIHTNNSIDAEGSISEYCDQALKCGLKEICITNHCELDPQRDDNLIKFNGNVQPLTRAGLFELQKQVLKAKEYYGRSGLTVKFGLEVGYYAGIESRLQSILDGISIDFLLGSIHCLNHICIDSSREHAVYFKQYKVPELLDNYFQAVEDLINSQLFDSLGHLDAYKKYGIGYYGQIINMIPEDTLRNIFSMMTKKGIALEINTAGLRRINEFYPCPSIMKLAKEQGFSMITIGSDAHRVEDLGKGIKQGLEFIKSFGGNAVYAFDKRKPIKIEI